MGFDQKAVTDAIGQGSTQLAFEAPTGGNIGTLSTVGTVNRGAATLPMIGSAFPPSTVDTLNSPISFTSHGATSPGKQGRVVPASTSPPLTSSGSVRYAKVLSVSPKQAQESFHLAPRTVSMESATNSKENTLTDVEELPKSRTPLDRTRIASNVSQSFMEEIRLMMQELRQDFTALQSRVNALPAGNNDGTLCGVLEAVEAEKKERRREMGELAAYVNMSLAEIRAQANIFSERLTSVGDLPAVMHFMEETERLEGIVKSLLRPERDGRAELAMCLEAERAGRVQDLNNERDARVGEMDEVRQSIRALSEKLDGHSGNDAFRAQELVHERDAREKGNAELAMALEEVTVRALEHCNSLEQRVASQMLAVAPVRNPEAMVALGNVLTSTNEEQLCRIAAVEALCNEGQRELQASVVDLQAKVAQHREHMHEVETGLVQGLAEDVVALKEHGASIDALHSDVKVLQASAIDTAELLLELQQALRKDRQISHTDVGVVQGGDTHKAQLVEVESHKTQLGHLEAAHTSHGSKLSSLEAAHGHHATLVESHGVKLSELATAHEFHLSAVETHEDKLGQLEAAHGQATSQLTSLKDAHSHHTSVVESHKAHLSDLEAARSSQESIVESHGSKLSSLEAARGHHTTMFESHGNQLSSLTDAHSHHTSMMETHKAQLGDLEAACASHASIVESHGSKLICLEAAHGNHATMVESYGTQLRELVTAHEQQLSALETHRDQLRHLEAAHGHATALVESYVDQLSSLKDCHSIDVELHKQHISELQAAQGHHTSTLESLQHQVNSVQNFEQLVSRLSVDMDVIRQRQQDSKGRLHESHDIAGRFEEHTTLINELRSKINELEVSSVESAELHKSWKVSQQELHQALKQRLPTGSNPEQVGHLEDDSLMVATLKNDLQVLQVENACYKEAGAVEYASNKMEVAATKMEHSQKQVVEGKDEAGASERASIQMEAAATKIQSSARGVMARKLATERMEQVGAVQRAHNKRDAAATRIQRSARGRLARRQLAEHKEARAADIQLVTSELQVPVVKPVMERQETGLSSAMSERQVTGSDNQSVSGKPQAQRSWWQSLTSGGSPQNPISPHATPLQFTILGAKGLRVADWTHGEGKSDPYCTCELKGKSKTSKTQTQVIDHDLDPIWNHKATFNDYTVGDSLVFKIYDADYIDLGSLVLPSEKFHPHGFEGELPLENAGEDSTAVLRLKIEASLESTTELPVEVTVADTVIATGESQVAVSETVVATSEPKVVVADTNIATSEHVIGTESVVERQDSLDESAITEHQVTGPEDSAPRSLWNRLTSRVSSQIAASNAFQAAASEATPLRMTIQSARGLRVADWTSGEGKSDPYCICELKGKSSASKIQTQVIDHDLDPEWNHEGVLNDYTVGDSLVFKIYDVDYIFLGSLVLPSEHFHPHGFEGELPLEDAGEDSAAVLRLKIEPLVDIKDEPAIEASEDWEAEY